MQELTIPTFQKLWCIQRPGNLEELWDTLGDDDFGDDERLPYWVEVWPASLALGEWLTSQQLLIAGEPCLDIGCGLGFTGLVAAELGAHVVAMDYEPEALRYAHLNAFLNEVVTEPLWVVADWRYPAFQKEAFSFMWAGDIMYEQRFIQPVTECILHCLKPGGCMWVSEPSRAVYKDFLMYSTTNGLQCRKVHTVNTTAFEGHDVPVNIWEIRKS